MKNYINALLLLKNDHLEIKRLFQEYASLKHDDYEQKRKISDHIRYDLEFHTKIEEKIFYPAIQGELDDEGQKLFTVAYQGHCVVKYLLEDLKKRDVTEPLFDLKFRLLQENVQYYIEEEAELFSAAENIVEEMSAPIFQDQQQSYSMA